MAEKGKIEITIDNKKYQEQAIKDVLSSIFEDGFSERIRHLELALTRVLGSVSGYAKNTQRTMDDLSWKKHIMVGKFREELLKTFAEELNRTSELQSRFEKARDTVNSKILDIEGDLKTILDTLAEIERKRLAMVDDSECRARGIWVAITNLRRPLKKKAKKKVKKKAKKKAKRKKA